MQLGCHPECLMGLRPTEGDENPPVAVALAKAGAPFDQTGFPPSREGQGRVIFERAKRRIPEVGRFQNYRGPSLRSG